ncbi:hypothetical protein CWI38_0738p0010 [Hamiltosporidium tvaerminnensis]|uniref:Uncharacterized protein n=1 Tax=Hamiltosporidium tvaerminnensis TaxID=1176355 RepID=A0A4Q9LQJ8_9MICR|nr:hypothetical protein CWI38_1537p0020 [Hamiltosporidium tvaerminnensis]TBU12482.1 hypothetical protein CWI38_0738p0010 [Hamiltosporidium tvaerminnensis]
MLKDEDVKKISESKTNEINRLKQNIVGADGLIRNSRVDTERYRDARNEENRIHLAKNKQSTMAHMELIQKYNTIHRSREMYRNVSDTRRAFITRTNSLINRWSEHFRELRNERGDQADTDNVFDELEDMDNEISSELIKNAGENYIKELTHLLRENEKKRKCLKNGIQQRLTVFEKKILQRIYGFKEENGRWRKRHNSESTLN